MGGFCDNPSTPEARQLLSDIRAFLFERFEYEKKIMISRNSEDTWLHHEQHELMFNTLSWSIEMAQRDKVMCRSLYHYLDDWFRFHTENLDRTLCEPDSESLVFGLHSTGSGTS